MSLADTPPSDAADPAPPEPARPPESATLSAKMLLRATGACAAIAAVMGVVVAPGMRGNATEKVVQLTDRVSASLAYLLYGLLAVLLVRGAYEVMREKRVHVATKVLIGVGAATAAAVAAPALHGRLPAVASVVLTVAAVVVVIPAAWSALRAPHTRAVSVVLMLLGVAAIARLGAWEVALAAWERTSTPLLRVARGLASAGVVFEGIAQMVAAAWLGTRARLWGQLLSSLAIVAALALTIGAMRELHADTPKWQAILHVAFADVASSPVPASLTPIATFLAPAAILLAVVAAIQPSQPAAIVVTLALALISRGALDAPLRALSAIVAGVWITVAWIDERAMWRSLIDSRKQRISEGQSEREANRG